MPNYFYIDANGQRSDPLNEQQLQAMVEQGVITQTTPLETDTGHRGVAGQIPGLNFNNVAPPKVEQTTYYSPPRQSATYSQTDESTGRVLPLFDLGFRDVGLSKNIRKACRYVYSGYMTLGIICGIGGAITAGNVADFEGFLIYVLVFLFTFPYSLSLLRLICEWQIVLMDYINQKSHRE